MIKIMLFSVLFLSCKKDEQIYDKITLELKTNTIDKNDKFFLKKKRKFKLFKRKKYKTSK
jgi:hypothetical protein